MRKIFILSNFILVLLFNSSAQADSGIAIITNKATTVNNLTTTELNAIFKLDKQHWQDGKKVILALPAQETADSKKFNSSVYKMNAGELKKFWFTKIFSNKISSPPKTFSSGSDIIKFVAATPGAIGYINAGAVNPSVKVLSVNGSKSIE